MPLMAVVVDDSMLIRYTVSRFLEERGYTVESAANGLEAMAAVRRRRPDLIVTDLQMPEMSGGELITALKKEPETATVPIIVVAGKAGRVGQNENRADFTISKDIDIETELGKALDSLHGTRTRAQAAGK